MIPIEIKGSTWVEFYAYVDSGASYSVFHSDIAEILGLNYENGEKTYITVGDGSLITVFKHQVQVRLEGQEFMASIGFSKNLGIGFNILGRESFFDRFVFCFDDKNKVLIIK
jgi:predicted aspartyl protease